MTEPAIDTGMILEALNDKVDRDCRNVDTASGADAVIEYQIPTAENNYTWYRKYKSGWVEQGGEFVLTIPSGGNATVDVNLLVTMVNDRYTVTSVGGFISNVAFLKWNLIVRYTNKFNIAGASEVSTISGTTNTGTWQVSGMSAQS